MPQGLDNLEHDSLEEGETGSPDIRRPKEDPPESHAKARRADLKETRPKDQPWLHPDNPAIWEGDIDDDDD